jgi:hypothetical protein
MSEPYFAGQKAGRDADKCSGDHITDEMPFAQGCIKGAPSNVLRFVDDPKITHQATLRIAVAQR